MIKARILVTSTQIAPETISKMLNLDPSSTRRIGDLFNPNSNRRSDTNQWALDLRWPTGTHGGITGIWSALTALGPEVAAALGGLANPNTRALLDIEQNIDGYNDSDSKGLAIPAEAIDWLARAHMAVDVDQYVYLDCSSDDRTTGE